jgi:hypothetical protein
MGKGPDAYGIFSHSQEGGPDAGIGQGSEYRGGLLYFWKDKYFACVYADRQTDESAAAVLALAKEIEKRLRERAELPHILNALPAAGLQDSSLKYFHQFATLNYHYYLAEDNILNLDEQTEAVLARYEPDGALLLCVKYPDSAAAHQAIQNFAASYIPEAVDGLAEIESGKWVEARQAADHLAIVFDAPNRERAESLAGAALTKIMSMEKQP